MIDKVGKSCTGCGTCEARCPFGAISFEKDTIGFAYPHINAEKCTKCNLCESACPALADLNCIKHSAGTCYAAFASDKPKSSSSGGSFYAIAKKIIADGGVAYGAAMTDGVSIRHERIDDPSSIDRLCGSKYIQSFISPDIFKSVETDLKKGLPVIFSGTPCQVAGLRLYLRKDFDNLYTIDLVCHGVPSPGVFSDYIRYCEKLRHQSIAGFLCRDNRAGWNNIFKSTIKYTCGKEEYNTGLANLWNRIFFSELITRMSCHECRFTQMHRVGDLTLGDFWGIKTVRDYAVSRGVSLLMCNTPKGKRLLSEANINIEPATTNIKEHPNLFHPTKANTQREEFQQYYLTHGFAETVKRYFGFSPWLDFKLRVHSRLHKFLGR